jgi:Xaa-Pro aminopeptidase
MSPAPQHRSLGRIVALRQRFDQLGLSALLVTHQPNVFYLSNFRGSAGMLLLTRDAATLIVDSRYETAATDLLGGPGGCDQIELALVESSFEQAVASCVERAGRAVHAPVLGIESTHMTVAQHEWFVRTLAGSWTVQSTTGLVEEERVVKDVDELTTLREAGRRISVVMTHALAGLRPGVSEREVAADIDRRIAQAGFDRPAFETIVASGPNTALPHARPSHRLLQSKQLVLLDFGGVLDGYCVDLTRVASLSTPSDEAIAWHRAVQDAHQAAVAIVRPGVLAVEVDGAARNALVEHGLGEAFSHGTGHGLGIEVHEAPRIGMRRGSSDTEASMLIRAGMVFTIEPGVYLPSRGGIRLEDDLIVTDTGCELLTNVPLDLRVV